MRDDFVTISHDRTDPRTVVTRAPARLDLAGGWTDVPPYSDDEGGCVCNVAIARYATVRIATQPVAPRDAHAHAHVRGRHEHAPALALAALRRADARDVSVDVWNDFPVSAGLGGSSAACVALGAALDAWRDGTSTGALDDARRGALAEWSRAVEVEDAGIAGGRQDHYAAAFGGALRLDFQGGDSPVRVTRLALADATLEALARRCVVVYTGESRISGSTITAVLAAYQAGEPRVVQALARMKAIAAAMADALVAGHLDDVGALLAEHWTHQRALHPSIPTARVDEVIRRAAASGALGAKALGASGGGCVLALAAEGREADVRRSLAALGEPIDVEIDRAGVRLIDPT